jgi:lysophospholipase
MVPLSQQDSRGVELEEKTTQSHLGIVDDALINKLEEATQDYWTQGRSHFFFRKGYGSLHARYFSESKNKKLLVISPGRGESSLKYAEFLSDCKGSGFDFLVLDHRGQGFSERYSHCLDHGHIENSFDYVSDLKFVVKHFKDLKHYKKCLLLGHSMGAAIGTLAQIEEDSLFQGMILASAMLKIKTRGVPEIIARAALEGAKFLNWDKRPLYRNLTDIRESFEENLRTSSLERFHYHLEVEKRYPQLRMGAPTLGWVSEGIKLTRRIQKQREKLSVPILLMQAEKDALVCSRAQDQFAHEVTNCRIIRLKESRHEVLSENDDIRSRALVQIKKFIVET